MANKTNEDVKKKLEKAKTLIAKSEAKIEKGQVREADLQRLAEILATFTNEQQCW